jgi:uncharacterized protein YceK
VGYMRAALIVVLLLFAGCGSVTSSDRPASPTELAFGTP